MPTTKNTLIALRMTNDLHSRVKKAAAKNDVTFSEYVRESIVAQLHYRGEYTITGPKKGNQ